MKHEAWVVSIDDKNNVMLLGRTGDKQVVRELYEHTATKCWNRPWTRSTPTFVSIPDELQEDK